MVVVSQLILENSYDSVQHLNSQLQIGLNGKGNAIIISATLSKF